jgi:hypothetical protein
MSTLAVYRLGAGRQQPGCGPRRRREGSGQKLPLHTAPAQAGEQVTEMRACCAGCGRGESVSQKVTASPVATAAALYPTMATTRAMSAESARSLHWSATPQLGSLL